MAEASLAIRSYSGNRVRIDPTEISADGGLTYPRLVVPLHLDLAPIQKQGYSILNLRAGLTLGDRPGKLGDSIPLLNHLSVWGSAFSTVSNVEFVLDQLRVREIESRRNGNLKIRLEVYFFIAFWENCPVNTTEGVRNVQVLTGFETPFAAISFDIPQSHWVDHILPNLGQGKYFLVEIPAGTGQIKAAWQLVEKADAAFSRWDTKSVFAHCRETATLLDKTLKDAFGTDHFAYRVRWTRASNQFNNLASLGLHIEDIKGASNSASVDATIERPDAEHLLIVTKSLVKYAEELLSTRPHSQ